MTEPVQTFETRLALCAAAVEGRLSHHLAPLQRDDEIARPDRLLAAMRYAVLNGGKRLRPFLLIEATRLVSSDGEILDAALDVAAALECIHCYSLVHDDLPAMDDDATRRGLPTVHIAFDEATAILAGDALLTLAFDIVGSATLAADRRVMLVTAMARAAGLGGMAGGQMLDLSAEGEAADEQAVVRLQAMKTGALIRFACEAGGIVAGAGPDDRQRLRLFGETVGLAFQLADDLLDVRGDAAALGKATGKDAGRGKATLVALNGTDWAERQLGGLVAEAETLLAPYGSAARTLVEAAHFVVRRSN